MRKVTAERTGRLHFGAGFTVAAALVAAIGALPVDSACAEAVDAQRAVRNSQAAIGRRVSDHRFVRADGRMLQLAELRGRPIVVSLVYTSCHEICPGATAQLQRIVHAARQVLRDNPFTVLTVGFDSQNDTPERMASFAASLRMQREPEWYFLSADPATIAALAGEIGFSFAPTPRGFDHMLQTSVLDREGRVHAQIYGLEIAPPALIEPLKRIYLGRTPPAAASLAWLERVRLLCTVFDPKSGRYRFDYSLILSAVIGALCFAAVAAFIVHAWRARRRDVESARPALRSPAAEAHETPGSS
jgi:protein SCO1/2